MVASGKLNMPATMQTNGKNNKKIPWILPGFCIGISISVLSRLGISGLLFIIKRSNLPEEELVIFTSLFYGIVFFIFLGGVRSESRRHKLLISRRPYENSPPPPSKTRATITRIKTILWNVFCVFSLGWLTPVLIIYWTDVKHPKWAVAACAFLSSLLAGTVYLLKKESAMGSAYNHLMFFVGVIFGAALVSGVIV